MPRADLTIDLRAPAKQAISETLAAEPLERPAVVVVPDSGEECCTVGFEAVVLPAAEVPADAFTALGEQEGLLVFLATELLPDGPARLAINFDASAGRLMAMLLPAVAIE